MTDYQPTEQDRVLLDYAQTAQRRADPWVEFQYLDGVTWHNCNHARHPGATHHDFRRKPRTCILIGPDGTEFDLFPPDDKTRDFISGTQHGVVVFFTEKQHRDQWREALKNIQVLPSNS